MTTLWQSKQVQAGAQALNIDAAGDVDVVLASFTVPTGLANGDVIELGAIPAYAQVIDFKIVTQALDSNGTPTVVFNAGFLSGTYGAQDNTRTCGADFINASTVGQHGGIQIENVTTGLLAIPSVSDRGFGITLTTGAATLAVGANLRAMVKIAPTVYDIDAA